MSTGSVSCSASSASSREALETSVMSLLRRFSSSWIWPHQLLLLLGRLGVGQRLRGRARGGQRVLELVRHVLGEALAGLDAPIERGRHLAEGGGHLADLVGAVGELGQLVARR